MRPNDRALVRRTAEINEVLTSVYGRKKLRLEYDAIGTLVETILSQNTSDTNSHRAFKALKRRYPDWRSLIDADASEVATIIRCGGLAEVKARRIIAALDRIVVQEGQLNLSFLSEMSVQEAMKWLTSMDGIGPKTASIVLLFSFGRPTFPVDTHVFRVSRRLGLVNQRASRERAQAVLERLVREEEYYNMHLNLIEHGRRKCKARNPLCNVCEVSQHCPSFRKLGLTQA